MLYNLAKTQKNLNDFKYGKKGIATFKNGYDGIKFTIGKQYKVIEFFNEKPSNIAQEDCVKYFIVENDNGQKEIINQNRFNNFNEIIKTII